MRKNNLLGFLFCFVGLSIAAQGAYAIEGQGMSQEQFAEKATVKEINKNVEAFLGQRVQVEGEVEDVVVNGQSFILEGDTWTSNDILVVSKGRIVNLSSMANEDRRVSLVGTVKHANFYEIENELSANVDPDVELDKKKGVTYILLDNFQSAGQFSE